MSSNTIPNTHHLRHEQQLQQQEHNHQQQDHRSLIINGVKAPAHRYPYFVLLNGGDCGGSLIAPDIVLTAGHCLPKRTEARNYTHDLAWARVGIVARDQPHRDMDSTADGDDDDDDELSPPQDFIVRRAIRHHKFRRYGDDEFRYDYTILQLDGISTMKYVPLLRDESILLDSHHSQLTALGLGWTQPDEPSKANWLHQVNLTWIDNDVCANATDGEDSYQGRIDASHICTFEPGKDSCAYDSGSPMIVTTTNKNKKDGLDHYQDYLVAQVSWGMECADETFPAVNARLSTVLDWIDQTVCAWSVDPPADFGCYPTTTVDNNAGPWNFSIPFMGNADFVYIMVACLFAACGSRMYWRRRRHNYEALK